jgi:hypothetical protein
MDGRMDRWSDDQITADILILIPHISFCIICLLLNHYLQKQTSWLESASDLYQPCGRRLSVKFVRRFAGRGASRIQRGMSPTAVISVF